MGVNFADVRSEGDFLLFENDSGQGELVSQLKLKNLIKKSDLNLDLVFVAACNSE